MNAVYAMASGGGGLRSEMVPKADSRRIWETCP